MRSRPRGPRCEAIVIGLDGTVTSQISAGDDAIELVLDAVDQPEMVELLVAMGQADIQVVLATNNRAEAQEALATRYLDSGVASALVNSGMVGAALPTPEFFAVCVEVTGCQPDQILFVDHDVANLVSAASVGMRTIALDRTRPESVADVVAAIQKAMLG